MCQELQEHSTRAKPARVHCMNRFAGLHADEAGSVSSDEHMNSVDVNVNVVGHRIQALTGREGCE